jgi:hypothetical protein
MITPLHRVDLLVEGRARPVYLKLEGKNPGGSIKDRTARGLVASLDARGLLGLEASWWSRRQAISALDLRSRRSDAGSVCWPWWIRR